MLEPIESRRSSCREKVIEAFSILAKLLIIALDLAVVITATSPFERKSTVTVVDRYDLSKLISLGDNLSRCHYAVYAYNLLVTLVMMFKVSRMKIEHVYHKNIYRNYIFIQFFVQLSQAVTQFWFKN